MTVVAAFMACGLVACSTHDQAAEQGRRDLANSRTAKGRYVAMIRQEVIKKWNVRMNQLRNSPQGYGKMVVEFYVNPQGKVEDLRIIRSPYSTPTYRRFTMQAIREVKLPPMPAEVVAALTKQDQGRLRLEYNADRPMPESGLPEVAVSKDPYKRFGLKVQKMVHQTYEPYIRNGGAGTGVFHIALAVDANGKVEHVRVTDEAGNNEKLRVLTQRLIYAAKLPPIPAEVIPLIPKDHFEHLILNYDVIIH